MGNRFMEEHPFGAFTALQVISYKIDSSVPGYAFNLSRIFLKSFLDFCRQFTERLYDLERGCILPSGQDRIKVFLNVRN